MRRVQRNKGKAAKETLKKDYYRDLNAELGAEFTLFAFEHPEWLQKHLPDGATVVLQTTDPGFNTWARQIAELNRARGTVAGPLVLVHIRKLRPRKSRIVRAEAELVA